jgi:hypothetical protein
MRTFGAEGVNGSEALHIGYVLARPGGMPRRPNAGGAESWAGSAPKMRREQ